MSGDDYCRTHHSDRSSCETGNAAHGCVFGPVILAYFVYGHLPERLQAVSAPFCDLAWLTVDLTKPGAEQSVALRKLLEAKDAAVRAAL